LAKAELRAGKLDDAAAHVDRVLATPLRRADLLWTAARVRKAQGKTRESQRLASDARSQNPKIEILEGSL
jgi:phosphohistidine phosphatase SixA